MSGILDALACASDPIGCGVNWLDSLPVLAVILAAFAIGAIAGAHLGKVVVYSILTLGVVALFLDKRGNSDTHEHVQGKDAAPTFRKQKAKERITPKPSGKTAAQRWIAGE